MLRGWTARFLPPVRAVQPWFQGFTELTKNPVLYVQKTDFHLSFRFSQSDLLVRFGSENLATHKPQLLHHNHLSNSATTHHTRHKPKSTHYTCQNTSHHTQHKLKPTHRTNRKRERERKKMFLRKTRERKNKILVFIISL